MSKNKYIIQVYTSFVTSSHFYLKGRVLKNKSPMSFVNQGPISSLFNTMLRVRSRELPNIPIQCDFGDHTFKVETDCEGYFEVFHNISTFPAIPKKIKIEGQIKNDLISFERTLSAYLNDIPHGIISDIDDTILVTRVRSFFKLRLLINSVFINPFRRKPIKNAAEAFHKMLDGFEGLSAIIYLSNSPWNIYDYLQAFLMHNAFPVGEVILRDMGIKILKSKEIPEYNKYIEIEKLLIAFKDTTFTLIGDTGEKDFDIYLAILEKHPERIDRIILNNAGNANKIDEVGHYLTNNKEVDISIVNAYSNLI